MNDLCIPLDRTTRESYSSICDVELDTSSIGTANLLEPVVGIQKSQISEDFRIYRMLRSAKEDTLTESRLLGKVSPDKRKNNKRLCASINASLLKALDDLLPFQGLWYGIKCIGDLQHLLAMRTIRELVHYLELVKNVWSNITLGSRAIHVQLDCQTVQCLESLAPSHSLHDRRRIDELMDNGTLFSSVTDQDTRNAIKEKVLAVQCRIPSLRTFFEDSMFLSPCSRIMRSFFPSTWQSRDQLEEKWRHIYEGDHFCKDYRELWTFLFRHSFDILGKSPRKDAPSLELTPDKEQCKTVKDLALEARRLNFISPEIQKFTVGAHTKTNPHEVKPAEISNHIVDLPRKYRCGAPHVSDYKRDRTLLYLSNIDRDYLGSPQCYVTTFAVKRDIFNAFFGIHSNAHDNLVSMDKTKNETALLQIDPCSSMESIPNSKILGKRMFDELS